MFECGIADYSCGCMDYGFKRPKEPWEAADGAVYLLAGLSEVQPAQVPPLMPLLAEVALLDHWPQARSLQTTIWTQVPHIMKGLGKQVSIPVAVRGAHQHSTLCSKHRLFLSETGGWPWWLQALMVSWMTAPLLLLPT